MITYNSDHDLIDRTVHPKDKRKCATATISVHGGDLDSKPHEFKTNTIRAENNVKILEEVERIGRSLVDTMRPLDDFPTEMHFTYIVHFWGNDSNGY